MGGFLSALGSLFFPRAARVGPLPPQRVHILTAREYVRLCQTRRELVKRVHFEHRARRFVVETTEPVRLGDLL